LKFLFFFEFILAICAMSCTLAQADTLDISLQPSVLSGTNGGAVSFDGSITNTTNSNIYLNSDNFNLSGFSTNTIDDSALFSNTPYPFTSAQTTGDVALFTVDIPAGMGAGTYNGVFQLLGGAGTDSQDVVGTAAFSVIVGQPSNTAPEPSINLLIAAGLGLVSFAGLAARKQPSAQEHHNLL
jgi:hypothetical protein